MDSNPAVISPIAPLLVSIVFPRSSGTMRRPIFYLWPIGGREKSTLNGYRGLDN